MPSRLSNFLLAFLVTLPFSAVGEPVPGVTPGTEASPLGVEDDLVPAVTPNSDAKPLVEVHSKSPGFDGIVKPHAFGWIEQVILSPELRWKLDAKLDTGADTSSLDAHDIRRIKYKGQSYVRFSIKNPETGKKVSLRRPYVRTVKIRSHSGEHQRRRVVLMTVCLGDIENTIEVTLTDREYFDYPILLGRSALSGVAVVNPMVKHTTEPSCKNEFNEFAEGEIEMGVEIDKSGSDDAGKSAQDAALPVKKSSSGSPKVLKLLKKPVGSEQTKNVPTENTGDEKPEDLGEQDFFYVLSGQPVVTHSRTIQKSGSHYVRS